MTKEEELLKNINKLINQHNKEKKETKEKQQQKQELDKPLTRKDLMELMKGNNQIINEAMKLEEEKYIPNTTASFKQNPISEKQQIAFQIWKDSKTTSIICLIAIVLPMITTLIAMANNGGMFALIVAMAGIIYPCFTFVKMISLQTQLYNKYGLKPLFQFKPQQIQYPFQQTQQRPPQQKGGTFF